MFIQSAFQTQVSDSSLFLFLSVSKAAAVFMCQQVLKLSTALALLTMSDSVPLICFRPRGGRAVAQGEFSTQQGPD